MGESQDTSASGGQKFATTSNAGRLGQATRTGTNSSENQAIFMLSRKKSKSRERRESRMFLVDGQLCWADDLHASFGSGGGGGGGGKRNSSMGLLFGSSMDLSGISVGHSIDSSGGAGSGSEEAISYRIKWCRENIIQLKRQTWPMEKKLQVLKASKLFIKQHQGELKQSKQAKDVIASTSAIFDRYWRHFKREFANFLVIITPWEMRIKKIESHFGSVVASYFTFLRWIFWLNLANSLVMVAFVMVPELIENVPDVTGMRKGELGVQQASGPDGFPVPPPEFNPTLGEMWEFEGFLKFSPIFYGYYSNVEISRSGFWRNPLAFLMSAMLTYLFCFICISRKLSQNTKLSRIGSKDDEYTFCWTVFVGWDFMIGNSETAYNKTSSLVMNLKEGILEEKEQVKDRDWRLIIRRVLANLLTLMLLVASAYVVTLAVQRSENLPEDASLLQKNELQLVMSGIQFMFPPLFDVIGIIEKYHPRKALSWQLGRILFLDFLNFYTLMFSLFGTVDQMGNQLNEVSGNITLLRKNTTYWNNLFTTTSTTSTSTTTTTTTPQPVVDNFTSSVTTDNNNSSFSTKLNMLEFLTTQPAPTSSSTMNSLPIDPAGFNVSTILTSVLLASSTIMPSINITDSVVTTTTSTTTTSIINEVSTFLTSLSKLSESSFTSSSPSPSSIMFSTTSFIPPKKYEQPVSSTTQKDDEDYPDLGEALKTKRLKRFTRFQEENKYDKNSIHKVPLMKRISLAETKEIKGQRLAQWEKENSESALKRALTTTTTKYPKQRIFIPPIQDPYKKVGRTFTSETPNIFNMDEENEEDEEEEEELLEGRLVSIPSKRPRTSTQKAILVRPSNEGGSGKQQERTNINTNRVGSNLQVQTTKMPTQMDFVAQSDEPEQSTSLLVGDRADKFNPSRQQPSLTPENNNKQQEVTTARRRELDETSTSSSQETRFTENVISENYSSTEMGGNRDLDIKGGDIMTTISAGGELLDEQRNVSSIGGQILNSQVQGKSALAGTLSSSQNELGFSLSPVEAQVVTSCVPVSEGFVQLGGGKNNKSSSFLVSNLKASSSSSSFNASEVSYTDCLEIPEFKAEELIALNDTLKEKLKTLCWETMFGQEMVKIVVMDLVMTVISAVSFEFMRACFVRYCNRFFFWDLERGFPGYQDFKIAENVLHLVNNQSTVWMGMFFAPGLPAINTVKLAVLMYVRSWAVLTCNIPHETVFKVSKSNNFYYWILLINLLICILPVAYAVTWIRPSWHCGPFAGECRMYIVVTKLVKSLLPPEANTVFKYLTSPGAVIPILISLILIIYYLASTVSSSKEANKELKAQLKKDKDQEAAVPEIRNTTVVEPTAAAVTTAGLSTTSSSIQQQQPLTSQPTLTNSTGQQQAQQLVASQLSANSFELPATVHESSTKPAKSLLMPPTLAP